MFTNNAVIIGDVKGFHEPPLYSTLTPIPSGLVAALMEYGFSIPDRDPVPRLAG